MMDFWFGSLLAHILTTTGARFTISSYNQIKIILPLICFSWTHQSLHCTIKQQSLKKTHTPLFYLDLQSFSKLYSYKWSWLLLPPHALTISLLPPGWQWSVWQCLLRVPTDGPQTLLPQDEHQTLSVQYPQSHLMWYFNVVQYCSFQPTLFLSSYTVVVFWTFLYVGFLDNGKKWNHIFSFSPHC